MRAVINTAKNVIEKGRMYVYHKEHNKVARKVPKTINIKKSLDILSSSFLEYFQINFIQK